MIVRNGIKSNLRDRKRTKWFSVLIVLLTVTVMLSLGVLLYCNAMMKACDEAYRSVALFEFIGSEYPNEDEPDDAAREAAAAISDESILAVPGVTAWTRGNTAYASVEGYERRIGSIPYGNRSVIVVGNVSNPVNQWNKYDEYGNWVERGSKTTYYTCLLQDAVYSRTGREGIMINILTGDSGFVPQKGKSYVLNGTFVDTTGTARAIGEYPMNGLLIFRVEAFADSDDLPYLSYTDAMEIPKVFLDAADLYRTMNNYVRVVPCSNVRDAYAFQQNDLQIADGEMPDTSVENGCVITADLAQCTGLKPGDTFTLNELISKEDDRYDLRPTGTTQTFTVCGVANESQVYVGTVWVIAKNADTPLFGYILGTASLKNDDAEDAAEALQSFMPEQVRVTLLDQGYGNAVQPFREVKRTAVNVLIVCSAGVAAVIILFAFLFVGRQSGTVKIMVSLGTSKEKIALWFISGALLICGTSTVLGTIIGTVLRPAVIKLITLITSALAEDSVWYSETSVGIVKQLTFNPHVPLWPNFLAAFLIILLSLLFCMVFLRTARKGGTRKRGKSRIRVPHSKTSAHGRGGLRFAVISIRRGGLRSLVVSLVSLALTVTVIVLGGVYQNWQNELDSAKKNEQIDGMVTSLDGRYFSNLTLSVDSVKTLTEVKGIEDVSVSYGYHYWIPDEMPEFNVGEHGVDRRQNWISSQPEMVALNSLSAAKEFYYTDPSVTWLEGYDESMLADTYLKPLCLRAPAKADEQLIPAVLSSKFLEEHNLALGDTFECMVKFERQGKFPKEVPVKLQVAASYIPTGGKAQIYVPLSFHIPPSLLTGGERPEGMNEGQYRYMEEQLVLRTCRFKLPSAERLESTRNILRNNGFSAVGHIGANRTTVMLRDATFLKFSKNMERNIAIGRVMSTVISLLIILLGFIISWLMTYSRRREFALMRGFGAKKRRVFASFFLEQAVLSFIGCLIGCSVLPLLYAGGIIQPLAAAAFYICYLLGTAASIRMIGKTNLMELLSVRE